MHPAVQGFRNLEIRVTLADQAPESRLDVAGRTAKAIVKIEVAEGGVEVVAPEQPDYTSAEPNAFGIGGWAT